MRNTVRRLRVSVDCLVIAFVVSRGNGPFRSVLKHTDNVCASKLPCTTPLGPTLIKTKDDYKYDNII